MFTTTNYNQLFCFLNSKIVIRYQLFTKSIAISCSVSSTPQHTLICCQLFTKILQSAGRCPQLLNTHWFAVSCSQQNIAISCSVSSTYIRYRPFTKSELSAVWYRLRPADRLHCLSRAFNSVNIPGCLSVSLSTVSVFRALSNVSCARGSAMAVMQRRWCGDGDCGF